MTPDERFSIQVKLQIKNQRHSAKSKGIAYIIIEFLFLKDLFFCFHIKLSLKKPRYIMYRGP